MSNSYNHVMLDKKINEETAVIGIVGLGYVGLPLAFSFLQKNYKVIGIDLSNEKLNMLKKGFSYIDDVTNEDIAPYIKNGQFTFYNDYRMISDCDVINICVPTPFTATKDPDLRFVMAATEEISKRLRKDQLIILKSTTYPETTEKEVLPVLEKSGLTVGKDFFLSFAPERVDPGNKKFKPHQIPVVVGGVTPECTRLTALLYGKIVDNVHIVSSPRVAEMTKLLENIFRNVNIALVNELALLCERMGNIDIWEVIEAAKTKPFGFMPFYPGPGLGGHCIPIDPYYLSWKAREYDFHTSFIELSARVNENMPYYVVDKLQYILNQNNVMLKGSTIFILGVAFKENIKDTRNSAAIRIIKLLTPEAGKILYNDPFVPQITINNSTYKSTEITEESLESADALIITDAHDAYDFNFIVNHSKIILDTRNAIKGINSDKIYKLGLR